MSSVYFFCDLRKGQYFCYVNHHPVTKKPIYVGMGIDKRYLPQGHEHHNRRWKQLLEKYLFKDIHTYVFPCISKEEAFLWEEELIQMFRQEGYDLYNMTDGGEGSNGLVQTQEHVRKRNTSQRSERASKVLRERNASGEISTGPAKGVFKQSKSAVEKIRRAAVLMHASRDPEKKRAILEKISTSNRGYKHSEASKEKNRKAHQGRVHSDETRQKMTEAQKRRHAAKKALLQCNTPNTPPNMNLNTQDTDSTQTH